MSKYLISGGGTGGHIFPAVSIANELRTIEPDCEILFVGAEGRMEMERVPAAGYDIVGLKVEGFDRKHILKNIKVLWNLFLSMRKAKKIIRDFKPDVAVGVGGYASGAALEVAQAMGVPVLLQEQNGFAGVTNKMLANKADKICVAYDGMEKFFPADKILFTGNPVRRNLLEKIDKTVALDYFGFNADAPVLFVMGGSLGAGTINNAMVAGLERLADSGVQVLWQTGKNYFDNVMKAYRPFESPKIKVSAFVDRMDYAYAAADVVVSRAGASSISELCLLGKASILVPSPNVAEDHQTHNAIALVDKNAALMIADKDAESSLVDTALKLIASDSQRSQLCKNILTLARPDAAHTIACEVIKLKKKH